MRAYAVCCALVLLGCGPSGKIPDEPPPRPDSQTSDLPPADFISAEVLVTMKGERRSVCYPMDILIAWLVEQSVDQQTWTQLDPDTWRLDGVDTGRKEHTVWVFTQREEGVELIQYKDSDPKFAFRDPREILGLYDPRLSYKRAAYVRDNYDDVMHCQSPYL